MLNEDLQHLLKKNQREDLLIIPKRSLAIGAYSLILIVFGLGFTAASLLFGDPRWSWVFGVCVAISLFLGRRGHRIEDEITAKYRDK